MLLLRITTLIINYSPVFVKYFLFVCLYLSGFVLQGQIIRDEIKSMVDSIGPKVASIGELASIFNHKIDNDSDRVGAAYYWIAKNIVYDTKSYFSKKRKVTYNFRYKNQEEKERKILKVNMRIADEAFKERKAVSRGFSIMFKRLCNNCGVECEIVPGNVKIKPKDIGQKTGRTDYFWNAVKMDGQWHLVDAAMGAGSLNEKNNTFTPAYNETFFLTQPDYFFLNHYPNQNKWLFCDKTREDFSDLPLFYEAYVDGDIYLSSPAEGIITFAPDDTLRLSFAQKTEFDAAAKTQAFSYAFEDDKAKPIEAVFKDGVIILEIPLGDNRNDFLDIFLNKEALVTFKIKKNTR